MSVLIIEDDEGIASLLKNSLEAEGYEVRIARDGVLGLASALSHRNDLIILDLRLPGAHGLEVCRQLRARGDTTPILMLSGLDTPEDRIEGLKAGADDYLIKPFSSGELIARVNAQVRRDRDFRAKRTAADGALQFDADTRRLWRDGKSIELTPTELSIMEFLNSAPGKVFSRGAILAAVWNDAMDPGTNVVDVYIGKLRRKLDEGFGSPLIETVRGRGYRIAVANE